MNTALSSHDERKIRQTLDQFMHWRCAAPLTKRPEVGPKIGNGLSNLSLLIEQDEQKFVLRLDGLDPRTLGLNRQAEWTILQRAYQADLAPRPVYFNPELGTMVMEYCESDPDDRLEIDQNLSDLAELLRKIHTLPTVKYRLNPLDRARRYLAQMPSMTMDQDLEKLASELQGNAEVCLCHNDLLAANRLRHKGRLLALDWEYAANGDPYFELAVICHEDALSEPQCVYLLEQYLQAPADSQQTTRLQDYRVFYDYLTKLWRKVTEHSLPH